MEAKGKACALLYCGDFDPGGLNISDFIPKNFDDLAGAVGWSPGEFVVERFGLNYDFIEEQGLTWIEKISKRAARHCNIRSTTRATPTTTSLMSRCL